MRPEGLINSKDGNGIYSLYECKKTIVMLAKMRSSRIAEDFS